MNAVITDGIIEAHDNNDEIYSESGRLEDTISQFTWDMPTEAIHKIPLLVRILVAVMIFRFFCRTIYILSVLVHVGRSS